MDSPQGFNIISQGVKYFTRPILPADKDLIQSGFQKLSRKSKYYRFFTIQQELSETNLKLFTEIDGINHVAWGILDETGNQPIPVGVFRFVRLKEEPDVAETALTVVDSYQRKGLGRILLAIMNITAAQLGIKKFKNYVLAENQSVMEILKNLGIVKREEDGSLIILETSVYSTYKALPNTPEVQHFKAIMKQVEEKMLGKRVSPI